MNSEIKIYSYPNGEIQRVQVVYFEDWSKLDFLYMRPDAGALDCFSDIYKNYLVPACPWIFGNMILFHIPEDMEVDFPCFFDVFGEVGDKLTVASIAISKGVTIKRGKPVFKDAKVECFWNELVERDCVRVVSGKLPFTQVIPVGSYAGYLSENEPDAAMKVNANFFIMDPIDCATVYDQVGTILGLCVKDGIIENPPLFHREALLVKRDGSVSIQELDVRDLEIEIRGKRYVHGKNATIYTRPERAKTPRKKGVKFVIVGRHVVAVKKSGSVKIPASGFVLCVDEEVMVPGDGGDCDTSLCEVGMCAGNCAVPPGDEVIYHGLSGVQFGIQVGNSIIRDGIKTKRFISRFYNIYHLERIPFPPSLYPMDFKKARAARIVLGADKDGKPMLFWAEGAGKLGYTPGEDSTGASLSELAEIAEDLGMVNAVNLDGGGSAQMLLKGQRGLRISDRNKADNSDAERLVPLGLVVR